MAQAFPPTVSGRATICWTQPPGPISKRKACLLPCTRPDTARHTMPRSPTVGSRFALHSDPNNPYLQRDLEVLWNQMSADEKQLAVQMEQ